MKKAPSYDYTKHFPDITSGIQSDSFPEPIVEVDIQAPVFDQYQPRINPNCMALTQGPLGCDRFPVGGVVSASGQHYVTRLNLPVDGSLLYSYDPSGSKPLQEAMESLEYQFNEVFGFVSDRPEALKITSNNLQEKSIPIQFVGEQAFQELFPNSYTKMQRVLGLTRFKVRMTGEILFSSAQIYILVDRIKWVAQKLNLPFWLVFKYVTAHEIGHSLGLTHNHAHTDDPDLESVMHTFMTFASLNSLQKVADLGLFTGEEENQLLRSLQLLYADEPNLEKPIFWKEDDQKIQKTSGPPA